MVSKFCVAGENSSRTRELSSVPLWVVGIVVVVVVKESLRYGIEKTIEVNKLLPMLILKAQTSPTAGGPTAR